MGVRPSLPAPILQLIKAMRSGLEQGSEFPLQFGRPAFYADSQARLITPTPVNIVAPHLSRIETSRRRRHVSPSDLAARKCRLECSNPS